MDTVQPLVLVGEVFNPPQPVQEVGQLGLALVGEQEVVEGLEATALIGFGDAGTAAQGLVEQEIVVGQH